MKPLVYWCRWHDARLLLFGRNDHAIWGEIASVDGNKPFVFEFDTAKLQLTEGKKKRIIFLDEMGVEH